MSSNGRSHPAGLPTGCSFHFSTRDTTAATRSGCRPDHGFRRPGHSPAPAQPLRRVFRDGFVVALLNPKTALFFAAFLPQFIDSRASPLMQTLALGGVFVGIACCTDLVYVLTASLVAPRLQKATRHAIWGNRLAGTSFIGLGVLTAMGTRPTR
jgi:threonine/homoserine/homoserine lactone efflux protein